MEPQLPSASYHEGSDAYSYDSGYAYYDTGLIGDASQGRGWATFIGVAALFVLGCWIVLTSVYIILHDDLLASAIKDRIQMQSAYEGRITDLRGEVGAVTGQLMLNQDEFDNKVEKLNSRQAMLEERQTTIAALMNDVDQVALALGQSEITGSLGAGTEQTRRLSPNVELVDAADDGNTIQLEFANQYDAVTISRPGYDILASAELPAVPQNRADRDLVRLAAGQYQLEADQFDMLNQIERNADAATLVIAQAIARTGIEPQEIARVRANENTAVGGPLIQVSPQVLPAKSSFERQLHRIRVQSRRARDLYSTLLSYPIRRPLTAGHPTTSRFGSRIDPFKRTLAHHSGVDFRANRGTPVHATAGGTVIMGRRNAGYGRMVEISHANGMTTRYAHLSRINVRKGQKVQAGDIIGRVGSTGRSTGPHLHYETRLNGSAINPKRFLDIGADMIQ